MRKNCVLGLTIIYILFFNFIECNEKEKKLNQKRGHNRHNIKQINSMERNNRKRKAHNQLRKNQEDEEEKTERLNTSFVPLNICLDLTNFNETIPDNFKEKKDIFINAMYRAKDILEEYLYIEVDYDFKIEYKENYFEEEYGILHYNEFIKTSTLVPYNLFVLFNFIDYSTASTNYEIAVEDVFVPIIGVVSIDTNLEANQLKLNYLTNFMLNQFIHILGFDSFTIFQKDLIAQSTDTFLSEEKFPDLINYAKKYFDCSSITGIDTAEDYFGNICWPSRLLLGELMTDFNYPE